MAGRKRKKSGGGGSPFLWFVAGLVIGLGGAIFLFTRGFMPTGPERTPDEPRATVRSEPELLGDEDSGVGEGRYDFFTVLPEMEVVVPERELTDPGAESGTSPSEAASESFILQAGSFRSAADADQMKARLALLGSVADIQQVTVNGETWHRVRIGPVQGARQADQLRRQMLDNGIDVLVLKVSG